MITLYDFNALNENDRAEVVWTGNYLAQREEDGHIVQLYSLPAFYAEVFYDVVNNEISRIRGFRKLHLLTPYIQL